MFISAISSDLQFDINIRLRKQENPRMELSIVNIEAAALSKSRCSPPIFNQKISKLANQEVSRNDPDPSRYYSRSLDIITSYNILNFAASMSSQAF